MIPELDYPESPRYSRRQYDGLAALYLAGHSAEEAAAELDMDLNAAYRFIRRNGMGRGRTSPRKPAHVSVRRAAVRRMYRALTGRQIALALDVGVRTVRRDIAALKAEGRL